MSNQRNCCGFSLITLLFSNPNSQVNIRKSPNLQIKKIVYNIESESGETFNTMTEEEDSFEYDYESIGYYSLAPLKIQTGESQFYEDNSPTNFPTSRIIIKSEESNLKIYQSCSNCQFFSFLSKK